MLITNFYIFTLINHFLIINYKYNYKILLIILKFVFYISYISGIFCISCVIILNINFISINCISILQGIQIIFE
jgi:hypothetical protein